MATRRTRAMKALTQPASSYVDQLAPRDPPPLPSVLYVARGDADRRTPIDPSFDAHQGHDAFDEGALVGVYDLREVRVQHVTHTLMPLPVTPTPRRGKR